MGEIDEGSGGDDFSVARRRVLKGAVAAGVGAAVWSAPHIRTLGTVPAGAGHTPTSAIVTTFQDASSLNANCNSGPPCDVIPSPEWGNSGVPGVIKIDLLSSNDTEVTVHQTGNVANNLCSFQLGQATVTTAPAGYTCVVDSVWLNCAVGGNNISNFTEFPGDVVPACPDNGTAPCNYFIRATVSCTPI